MSVLERLLPSETRRDVFEPALHDLRFARVTRSAQARGLGRLLLSAWFGTRVLLLFLDCWRVALAELFRSTRESIQANRGVPADRPLVLSERIAMFFYYLRHGFQRLLREPAFTVAAVLTLALGVGANVAVFAVVEAVLLRPLPYEKPEEIVIMNHRDLRTGITKEFIGLGDFVDITQRQTVFSHLATYGSGQITIYGEQEPFQVGALTATPALFPLLNVRPVAGRVFEANDVRPQAPPVMMLGYRLWQERYGGDPAMVGRSIRVGQQTRTVVGIMPPNFRFPPTADNDVILPITGMPQQVPAQRKAGWILAVARLKPGQTAQSATNHLADMSRQFERDFPEQNQATTYFAQPLRDALVGNTKTALVLMLAAVAVVLLIACANVANLQLARSLARRREIAVRMALGAGRGRLATLLLTESLVLAIVASAVGVVFAQWGVRALVALVPESVNVPGLGDVHMNGLVLTFALTITMVTALAFGLIAALTVRLENAGDVLVSAGRATMSAIARRATSGLVVAEVALAVVLLIGAGLILRSFAGLLAVDPGFRYQNVMTVAVQVPMDRYASPEARSVLYTRAFEALRALPDVEDVGAGVVVPLTGNNWTVPFERPEVPLPAGERAPDVGWQNASGGFFQALGIPLVAGRLFDERDRPGSAPVVIISEAIQRTYFPEGNAVGRMVRLGDQNAEIVGVVGNIRRAGLRDEPRADMYFSFERTPGGQITLFIRHGRRSGPLAGFDTIDAARHRTQHRVHGSRDHGGRVERVGARDRAAALAAHRVRRNGTAAGRGRHLRRDVVRGAPAHARDRHAHGRRRHPRRYPLAGVASGRLGSRAGDFAGTADRARSHTFAAVRTLWRVGQ